MNEDVYVHDGFLLENKYAEELYHNYAKNQPIIDYHNHLPPAQIARDTQFENISKVWLNGDHYKWRAMRTIGIDEKFITGEASDEEKFKAWAGTVPYTLRNPLYHWTHLELKRYFGIEEFLNDKTAPSIYENVNSQLQQPENSCRGLLKQMNVETLCTTEDPTDDLKYHRELKKSDFDIKVSTAFRPDKYLLIEAETYIDSLEKLGEAAEMEIISFRDLKDALLKRIEYFDKHGCKLCDHGLSAMPYTEFTETEVSKVFKNKLTGKTISHTDIEKFKTALMLFLCERYHQVGWVQQFHLGALRNNNKRMLLQLGPDTGWDSIGDYSQAEKLSKFLDALDKRDKLTKTVLYNLNPSDNEVFATMIGNFNDGSIKAKVQWGSGWWYLDQKDGMEKQMNTLSNMGLISCFIGMLTDSRSFLSFPRHEYFRRVLCNLFGQEMASGELPDDMELVGHTISNICYHNAKDYFDF